MLLDEETEVSGSLVTVELPQFIELATDGNFDLCLQEDFLRGA